jgi:hypothetical protein
LIDLPENIRESKILSKDDKEVLSTVEELPTVNPAFEDDFLKNIFQYYSLNPEEMEIEVHRYASKLLSEGRVDEAWQVLLTNE